MQPATPMLPWQAVDRSTPISEEDEVKDIQTTVRPPALDDIRKALAAGPSLRLAMLFGSAAKGGFHSGSDIDVGIIPVDPDLPLADELRLQSAMECALNRSVDLVRLDHAPTLVRYQVAIEGVALLEATPFERSHFVATAASEYLDFEPALLRAQKLFKQRLAALHAARVAANGVAER